MAYISHLDYTVRRWKDILERTLEELDREIANLSDSKDILEQALEAKNLPTEVNVENLVIREGRRGIDVVEDEVEDQIRKVRSVLPSILRTCIGLWNLVRAITVIRGNLIYVLKKTFIKLLPWQKSPLQHCNYLHLWLQPLSSLLSYILAVTSIKVDNNL